MTTTTATKTHAGTGIRISHETCGRTRMLLRIRFQAKLGGGDVGIKNFGMYTRQILVITWHGPIPEAPLDPSQDPQRLRAQAGSSVQRGGQIKRAALAQASRTRSELLQATTNTRAPRISIKIFHLSHLNAPGNGTRRPLGIMSESNTGMELMAYYDSESAFNRRPVFEQVAMWWGLRWLAQSRI